MVLLYMMNECDITNCMLRTAWDIKMDVWGGVYGERMKGAHICMLRVVWKVAGCAAMEIPDDSLIPQTGSVGIHLAQVHYMDAHFGDGLHQIQVREGSNAIHTVLPHFMPKGKRLMITEVEITTSAEPFTLFVCSGDDALRPPRPLAAVELCRSDVTDAFTHFTEVELDHYHPRALLYMIYDQVQGKFTLMQYNKKIYERDMRSILRGFAADDYICFGVSSCNARYGSRAVLTLKHAGEDM